MDVGGRTSPGRPSAEVFRFGGRDFEQDEWHVLGRLPAGGAIVSGSDDLESEAVDAHRWWTLDDLMTSSEVVHPLGLAVTVGRLLREGPPDAPQTER